MPVFSIGERRVELRGEHHYIAYDATIVGSVILESSVNVWFKVVIRADNDQVTIGEGSNIQDGSVLHSVGEGSLIGINSVIMNGARIGKHSLIGANTLIPEGKEIPEGVLVLGSPGKVVRDLKQEEKDYLLKIAQGYIDRSRFYKTNLKPI
jgi:carbonic anhydrase/acetyltransferase-like protein (isoleucine patch superfamily)